MPRVKGAERSDWLRQIGEWRLESDERDILGSDAFGELLLPPYVINEIWRETGGDAVVVTDVGQHQMWAAQYYHYDRQNQLITSGGLGSMGFSLGAAMGAKMGRPDDEVWVIVGDGGFQMCSMELATMVQEKLNIKIALMNNGYLGMVRQWQELMHNRRYSATPITGPDFVKLAEAYGVLGLRAETKPDVASAIRRARQHQGPVLIDFRVEAEVQRLSHGSARQGPARDDAPAQDRDGLRGQVRSDASEWHEAHPRRPGGEQARRAEPGGLALPAAQLQHQQPHRGRDGEPG